MLRGPVAQRPGRSLSTKAAHQGWGWKRCGLPEQELKSHVPGCSQMDPMVGQGIWVPPAPEGSRAWQ